MKNNRSYFEQASRDLDRGWHNADGFDNFDGPDQSFAGDDDSFNAGGGQIRQKRGGVTSSPYIMEVANANLVATAFTLFNSYNNRNAANQGNPAGVTVTYALGAITYTQFLAQTEHKNFKCGMIYAEVVAGAAAGLTIPITLTTTDANNIIQTRPILPVLDTYQQITTAIEWYESFNINGFTNFAGTMPASTTIRYRFYPEETVDPGRVLANNGVVRDYGAPKIGRPSQTVLKLDAKAVSALASKRV